MSFRLLLFSTVICVSLSASLPHVHAETFRAAAVKVDITPDRPQQMRGYGARLSTGVHMPIHHRVLVLDTGPRKLVIASTEVCLIRPCDYDEMAVRVRERYGVDPVDFWWTVTHTHSAPELSGAGLGKAYMPGRHTHVPDQAYIDETLQKLVDAIGQAMERLQPARLGIGRGWSEANINRRERREDGNIHLGRNPTGAVDREIGVFHVVKKDSDESIATLANYAIHATVLGGRSLLISGDAPGVVAEHVEAGTGAPLLFVNGAAGNIAPIYSVFPTPEEGRLDEFKTLLGDKILEAVEGISRYREAPLIHTEEVVFESPRKEGLEWTEDMAAYTRKTEDGQPLVIMPCRVMTIDDDVAVWSAPVELFCEISNAVRESSLFATTLFFGYTNGWIGYLPTEKAFADGGYEPRVTPFTPIAARSLTDQIAARLKSLKQP